MQHAHLHKPLILRGILTAGVLSLGLLAGGACATTPAQAASQAASKAAVAHGRVVIGHFEGKAGHDKQHGSYVLNGKDQFGWGWAATTDQRAGGKSTGKIGLAHPGADGSHGALKVTGELNAGFISPWAGAVWFPGSRPMQPGNLSAEKTLVFRVRGKPGTYSLMLMTGSPRSMPLYHSFTITRDWKQVTVPLGKSFPGADWKQVYFLAFSASAYGKFHFELDQVELH